MAQKVFVEAGREGIVRRETSDVRREKGEKKPLRPIPFNIRRYLLRVLVPWW